MNKKIKENLAFLVGVVVAVGMFAGVMLIELPFIYRGDISICIVFPLSVITGWFTGLVAYAIISLSIPGTDKGKWKYPFPKLQFSW